MKKFVLLLIFIIPFQLIAQSDLGFAPVGAKWHYTTHVSINNRYHSIHEVKKDTFIDGKVFSEITISDYSNLYIYSGFPNPYYVHYDSNIVYWFNPNSGIPEVLFNFNLDSGDSWSIKPICNLGQNPGYDSITFYIDSVYFDTINGQLLKHLTTSFDSYFYFPGGGTRNFIIAEYLGGINFFIPDEVFCAGGITHYWPGKFRCYEDSTFGQFVRHSPCDIFEVGLDQVEFQNQVLIQPNPTKNFLTLDATDKLKTVEIKGLTGSIILRKNINSDQLKIDVSEIPKGLYLISTFSIYGSKKTQKVIIQH